MPINEQRDKLINYEVFKDGVRKLGMADITLPKIKYKTNTMKGAGIGGDIDMPTLGMTDDMDVSIKWRTINEDLTELMAPKAHDLEFRGANQHYDAATGEIITDSIAVVVRVLPKEMDVGKLDPASQTDSQNTFTVIYIKITINDDKKVEIDKLNYIYEVNGTDYFASVRAALGL